MDNIGGMQRVAADLHDSLLAHGGGNVSTLVLRSPWSQRHWRTPLFLAGAMRDLRSAAAAREIDAVLFSSIVTASLAVPLKRHLSKHGVISAAIAYGLDATAPTWPYPHFVRKVFESLDLVLPISNATAEACRERGLAEEKCSVVQLGIRLGRFAAPASRAEAKARMLKKFAEKDAEPGLVLCSVGRLIPRKGVAWFIDEVMPTLPGDVFFLVAGEGAEREQISAAIHRHGLDDRVKLLGAVSDSDVELIYQGSDLFVMPNVRIAGDMEGFGLVMVEAGLCGLPAIAARIEGIADVVTEGENGHLVESRDVEGFSNVVKKYYESPEELRDASDRARRHTEATFGWDQVTQRYLSILEARAGRG